MPMKVSDMPSAARSPRRRRPVSRSSRPPAPRPRPGSPTARPTLQCAPSCSSSPAASALEKIRMRPQHEDEVEPVGGEQNDGEAQVQERFLAQGRVLREEAAERAGHRQADAAMSIIELYMRAAPGLKFCSWYAGRRAERRRPAPAAGWRGSRRRSRRAPCRAARAQRHQGDDQLGQVAEGGVQQSADGVAGAHGDLLGGAGDQPRDRNDGERRRKEDRGGRRAAVSSARVTGMKTSSQLIDGFTPPPPPSEA